jgi:hypothetical protein
MPQLLSVSWLERLPLLTLNYQVTLSKELPAMQMHPNIIINHDPNPSCA